jgi:hypothetical protein
MKTNEYFWMSHQAFPWDDYQTSLGFGRHLPADLLDTGRHLGAGMTMLASKLIEVGDRAVADGGQLDTFVLGGVFQKSP